MKEYSRPEVFEVSVASGIANEGLNLGVISFADGIGYWIQSVAEQSFQMLLKHVGYLGKRFEFKAADPSSPMIEEGASLPWAAELPELGKGLLGRPRFGDLQIELLDHVKHLLVILAPVATTAKEKVFGSLQPVFALIGQLFALSSAYLVNRLIEVLGVVKAVVHNPGLRSVQRGRVHEGRPHIHGRRINMPGRVSQRLEKSVGRLPIAVFDDLDHAGLLQAGHQRGVAVPPTEGLLVNANLADGLLLAPGQSPLDSSGEDALQLIIAKPKQIRSLLVRTAGLERFNDQRLEKKRESRMRFSPGHRDRFDAVPGTIHAGCPAGDDGLKSHRIEMAPTSLGRVIMDTAGFSAFRTLRRFAPGPLHAYFHFVFSQLKVYFGHFPRRAQTQQKAVMIMQTRLAVFTHPNIHLKQLCPGNHSSFNLYPLNSQ